jgi:hypothetical protein
VTIFWTATISTTEAVSIQLVKIPSGKFIQSSKDIEEKLIPKLRSTLAM